MKHKINHLHFVGIGGTGMSGIAEVLLSLGYCVSGSDLAESETVMRLRSLGAAVAIGHAAANIDGADVLVVSSAVSNKNPEIIAAKEQQIAIVPRAVMLAELMRFKRGIAIAGAHGKTTTTSLIAHVLNTAGLDPTCIIGGRLNAIGTNARLGKGEFLIAEADESDASFLYLQPVMAVVTNIDEDHMATYDHDFAKLQAAFVEFLEHLPFYGLGVLCIDDVNVRNILSRLTKPVLTYGFSPAAQLRATNVSAQGAQMHFDALSKSATLSCVLNLAGEHNVRNALAAIAIAREAGCDDAAIVTALASFGGVGRRFQRHDDIALDDGGRATLIDDYGHHPAEMSAVLAAARGAFPTRRILLAFQPHRFTRTHDLFDAFVSVLATADEVILAEVYSAGEVRIEGADAAHLAASMRAMPGQATAPTVVATAGDLPKAILRQARDGDVVITMGAGSIGNVAATLAKVASMTATLAEA